MNKIIAEDFNKLFPIENNYIFYGASKELWFFLRSINKLCGNDALKGSLIYDPVESISGSYENLQNCVTNFLNPPNKEDSPQSWFNDRIDIHYGGISKLKDLGKKIIITTEYYENQIKSDLKSIGLKEDIDFTSYQKVLCFWALGTANLVWIPRLDMLMTEKCTLNCTHCNMFMPYYQRPLTISLKNLKNDIDLFFSHFDELIHLQIVGGEPLLNKDLPKFLDYLGSRYRNRIDNISITTNGTVKISDSLMSALLNNNVYVSVSNYTSDLPKLKNKVSKFLNDLHVAGVTYENKYKDEWVDYGDPKVKFLDTHKVKDHFEKCTAQFRAIENGKLYYCHLSSSAHKSGVCNEHPTDYLNLKESQTGEKLVNFICGNLERGYVELCRSCNGCNTGIKIPGSPGFQGLREPQALEVL